MRLFGRVVLLSMLVGPGYAGGIEIVGKINQSLPEKSHSQSLKVTPTKNSITLLKLNVSPSALSTLNKRAAQVQNAPKKKIGPRQYVREVHLGMNNVPVLNQGSHGTCVTFANTAAVDAALRKGDYISQLCQLQLGRYLESNAYTPSGWDGAWGRNVLSQMESFGIVNKTQQLIFGCGGLTEYPLSTEEPSGSMSVEEFRAYSEKLNEDEVVWSPLLDVYQAVLEQTDTNRTLNEVKKALRAGDRVTFGVLLADYNMGVVGAVGTHHLLNDTWVLTPEIARDLYLANNLAGHELVITGYNDDAVAVDELNREHYGLLTLRNSWGDKVGDHGDFYMSYDYFKTLVIEAQRIRTM